MTCLRLNFVFRGLLTVTLAATLLAAPSIGQDRPFTFLPEEEGRREIWISHEEANLVWCLRIPERMFADEAMLVGHDIRQVFTPVEWQRDGEVWIYQRANSMDFPGSKAGVPVEYTVRLEPVNDGVNLTMTAMNPGDATLHNVVGHICLGHRSDRFRDPLYERTYIRSDGTFLSLRDTVRGTDPIRARYGVKGSRPIQFFEKREMRFWGPLSAQKADNGLIVTRSKTGDELVAFWFDPASEVFQNSDEKNMCIHSDPAFGDLEPGESKTVKGRIIHFRGDLAAFEMQYLIRR